MKENAVKNAHESVDDGNAPEHGVLVRRAMGKGHRERTWHRQLNCEPLAKDDYDFPPNYVFFNLHDELV
uniref:HDC02262 n=1 Tax=Drosophila melanogaster TaxID=7227 RepID=Q6IHL3_DROME|nr:TPA_inf: HDC02262 [Drosophila melanogaster]